MQWWKHCQKEFIMGIHAQLNKAVMDGMCFKILVYKILKLAVVQSAQWSALYTGGNVK